MKKTFKIILLVLAVLTLMTAAAFGWIRLREKKIYENAAELYAAGEYEEAKTLFEALSLTEEAADCEVQINRIRLRSAKELLAAGDFDGAKAEFEALGDFEDAADMVPECSFRKAESLYAAGNYEDAVILLQRLPNYAPASQLLTQMKEELYAEALAATYECRMDEAIMLWNKLDEYKDSQSLLKRCMSRVVNMASEEQEPATFYNRPGLKLKHGILYYHRIGLIYVPDGCTPDTPCMIF